MKIGGASLDEDLARIEAVLALLGGDGARLAVDANGRFDEETALRYADAMSAYGLAWYEEPGDPLEFSLNATVAAAYPGAVATGENLLSLQDARNLLRFGGMRRELDYVQFDPALAYGVGETIDIVAMMAAEGWSPAAFPAPWRQPAGAQHRRRPLTRRLRVVSGCLSTLRRFRRRHPGGGRPGPARRRTRRGFRAQSHAPHTAQHPALSVPGHRVRPVPLHPRQLCFVDNKWSTRAPRVFGRAKESKGAGGQRRSRLRERPPCRRHRDVVR